MSEITSLPGQAFRYVDREFGTVGLLIAGVMILVGVISIFIWIDRRR